MKLGDNYKLYIPVSDIDKSKAYYTTLGYEILGEMIEPHRLALISDGLLVAMLDEIEGRNSELHYFSADAAKIITELKNSGFDVKEKADGSALISDPSGFGIRINDGELPDAHKPSGNNSSKCGKYFEISLETDDIEVGVDFWKSIGFEIEYEDSPTSRWVTMFDGVVRIGLYEKGLCTHKFKNPSITFFESDMQQRIENLKSEGVPFIEDIPNKEGVITDAITADPDGQYLFLFYYGEEF